MTSTTLIRALAASAAAISCCCCALASPCLPPCAAASQAQGIPEAAPQFKITIRAGGSIAYEQTFRPPSRRAGEPGPSAQLDDAYLEDKDGRQWRFAASASLIERSGGAEDAQGGAPTIVVDLRAAYLLGMSIWPNGARLPATMSTEESLRARLEPGQSRTAPLLIDMPEDRREGAFHPKQPCEIEIARLR